MVFAAIEALATFMADFEPGRYEPEDSALLVSAFDRGERLCGAGKTLAVTRVAESHPHRRTGHRSPAEWFAAQTGAGMSEAIDQLKLGEALASQPEVEEALRAGKLSGAQASLISSAAKVNPDQEHDLVTGAQHDTRRQLKDRCLQARQERRSAEQAEEAAAAIHRARRIRTWTDQEGAFRLDGLFTPEAGARLLASLGPVADRFFHQARRNDHHEPGEAYTADALVALVTGTAIPAGTKHTSGGSSTSTGSAASTGSPRSRGTGPDPQADLFGSLAPAGPDQSDRSSPSDGSSGSSGSNQTICAGPTARPPSTTVLVRADLAALRRGSLGPGEICEIPGVGPISLSKAQELLGESLCYLVITDGVDVTTVTRMGRSIPWALKVALCERDQTCVVPGCDVRKGLEFDHWKIDYKDGGQVSLDNLARLCHFHHYQRTYQDFVLSGGTGHWRFDPPARPKPPPARTRRTKGPTTGANGRRRAPPGS